MHISACYRSKMSENIQHVAELSVSTFIGLYRKKIPRTFYTEVFKIVALLSTAGKFYNALDIKQTINYLTYLVRT